MFEGIGLEPHEVLFLQAFVAAGNSIELIPKADPLVGTPARPTDDFWWKDMGLSIEVKRANNRYKSIKFRIRDAVRRAQSQGYYDVKRNFIINIECKELTEKLRGQLSRMNLYSEYPIERLWVWGRNGLIEIVLEEKS